jgi:hypothetical protein
MTVESTTDETIEAVATGNKPKRDYFVGTTFLNVPRAHTEIDTYMKDGLSEFVNFYSYG